MARPPIDIEKLSAMLTAEPQCLWTFLDCDVEQQGVPLVEYFDIPPTRFKWLKSIRLPKGVGIDIRIPNENDFMTRWKKVMMACSHFNMDFPTKRPILTSLKTDGCCSKHKPFRTRVQESAKVAIKRCTDILDRWISWRLDTVVHDDAPKLTQVRIASRYFEASILLRYISTLQRPTPPKKEKQPRRLLSNMSSKLSIAIQNKTPPCPNKQARSIISGPWNARCFKSKSRDLLRMDNSTLVTFLSQYRRPQIFPRRKVEETLKLMQEDARKTLRNVRVPLRFSHTSVATLVSWMRCIVSDK